MDSGILYSFALRLACLDILIFVLARPLVDATLASRAISLPRRYLRRVSASSHPGYLPVSRTGSFVPGWHPSAATIIPKARRWFGRQSGKPFCCRNSNSILVSSVYRLWLAITTGTALKRYFSIQGLLSLSPTRCSSIWLRPTNG